MYGPGKCDSPPVSPPPTPMTAPLKIPALPVVLAAIALGGAAPASAATWIAAWGAAPTGPATGGPDNATVRDLVRVSVGGTAIRIRVANALSTDTPLVICKASVAPAKAPG